MSRLDLSPEPLDLQLFRDQCIAGGEKTAFLFSIRAAY